MESRLFDITPVALSVWVYRMLLRTYPVRFQREYGSHMLQVFRDCCLRTFHQGGTNGMARLWAITLFDLIQSLVSEHTQKETFMTRSKFIRLGGWSLMLGAVTLFIAFLGGTVDQLVRPYRWVQTFIGFSESLYIWATPVLLGIGMFGLRVRYGRHAGGLGKNILLLGGISGFVLTMIGLATIETSYWGWALLYGGNAFLLFCLAVFGLLALQTMPLPRWNSLPIWAGLPFPLFYTTLLLVDLTGGQLQKGFELVFTVVGMMQCIALFMLGNMLQGDAEEETATA